MKRIIRVLGAAIVGTCLSFAIIYITLAWPFQRKHVVQQSAANSGKSSGEIIQENAESKQTEQPKEKTFQSNANSIAASAADIAAGEQRRQDWEKQRQDFSDTQDRIMKTIRESNIGTELNLPKNWSTMFPYGQQWVFVNYNADGSSTWKRIK